MKSRFFIICYVSILALVLPGMLRADDYSGTTAFSFLSLPVGARATAMGEAFGSVPNDIQALNYNPATLATLVASQISYQHLTYVEDVDQEALAFGHAGRDEGLSWAVSSNYLQVSNITRTVATLQQTGDGFTDAGSLSTYDMSLGLSAAAPVTEDLRVGGTVKFLRESLADASSTAGAVDGGLLYRLSEEHALNLGASAENLGFASKFADAAVELPTTGRVGISGRPFAQWLLSSDFVKQVDTKGEFDIGAEITPRPYVSFRVGYRYALTDPEQGGLSNFSAGLGMRFNQISIDYAFVPMGDLGITNRISVNYRFSLPDEGPANISSPKS
jgi:hypothetical protein